MSRNQIPHCRRLFVLDLSGGRVLSMIRTAPTNDARRRLPQP